MFESSCNDSFDFARKLGELVNLLSLDEIVSRYG